MTWERQNYRDKKTQWQLWGGQGDKQNTEDFQGNESTLYAIIVMHLRHHVHASSVAQSCLTLSNPMDCNLPGSSVRGIIQARILGWVAISYSRRSSRPRDRTPVSCVSCIGRRILYQCATWEAICVIIHLFKTQYVQHQD